VKDNEWLSRMIPSMEKYYAFFTSGPKLIEDLQLSRYLDAGEGPADEVVEGELDDKGLTHYQRIVEFYKQNPHFDYGYDLNKFFDGETLTPLFYKGDRSMREAGYDPSCRFGQFNVDVIHYAPVCLNSLLYRFEIDMAFFFEVLEQPNKVEEWKNRAAKRKELINRYLWDEDTGMYFDYNFVTKKKRYYEFITTFFPLWAGVASEAQARRVAQSLSKFERAGGVMISTRETGCQWDAPFGWGPHTLLTVVGLQNYGFHDDAKRISSKFCALLVKQFEKEKTILEKYDVCESTSDTNLTFGYQSNEIGFGWTNAVFLELVRMFQFKHQ